MTFFYSLCFASVLIFLAPLPGFSSVLETCQDWKVKQETDGRCYIESVAQTGQGTIIAAVYKQIESPLILSISLEPFPTQHPIVFIYRQKKSETFPLKTHDGRLWSQDVTMDQQLLKAMQQGHILEIKAEDKIVAHFSLMGFSAAVKVLSQRCPISSK